MIGSSLDLLRGPSWSNRLALAPLTNKQSHGDGTLSDAEREWLVARARGGFGLVMTCAAYVAPEGHAWQGQLGISDDAHLPGLTRLASELRAAGAVSSVQLHHGGLRADPAFFGGPVVSAWSDEAKGVRALTTSEVRAAVESFVAAAARAERAGFDGVEVHGAHGYLVGQFLDGRHNHREDEYGDRPRFLLEILEGIRSATGPDFQLGLRLSPERFGIELADAVGAHLAPSWLAVTWTTSTCRCGTSASRRTAALTACSSTTSPGCRGTAYASGTPARCSPRPTSRGAWSTAPTSPPSAPARSRTTTSRAGRSRTLPTSARRSPGRASTSRPSR